MTKTRLFGYESLRIILLKSLTVPCRVHQSLCPGQLDNIGPCYSVKAVEVAF